MRARLIELDPELAASARGTSRERGLEGVEVVIGDGALTDPYAGAVPADLVPACGVLGNVPDADVERTLRAMPQLTAAGGSVIWTRHREAPGLTPRIRSWFGAVGLREQAFESGLPGFLGVGMWALQGPALPLVRGARLFGFVP